MIHRVGMADAKVASGDDSLRTLGLGSCVGLILYDPVVHLAGLAHIMLPDAAGKEGSPAKYADTGTALLLTLLLAQGASLPRIKAKVVGGAQMFAATNTTDAIRVGPRNVSAVLDTLLSLHIPVIASDVGGNYGRTVEVWCDSGRVSIRTALHGESFL